VYMTSRDNAGVYDSIGAVQIPVLIVRVMEPTADRDVMDFRYSPTFPGLVGHFRHAREIHLPERTHFLPMEEPALVARYVVEGTTS
jgi:lipase